MKKLFSPAVVFLAATLGFSGLPSVAAQGLVFHYEFNETSGTTVSDSVGNRDLTLQGATTWGSGVRTATGGLDLKATSGGFNTGANGSGFTGDDVISLTQYSISGWYQVSGTPSGSMLTLANTSGGSFRISFDAGNKMIIYTQGRNITTNASSIISDSAGEWVFFAMTFDTTSATPGANWNSAIKIYVANEDSANLTSVSILGLTGSDSISASALSGIDRIVLGNNTGTSAATYRALASNARMDDIRLYDGVLSATELDAIRLQAIPEASTSAALAGIGVLCVVLLSRRQSARQ